MINKYFFVAYLSLFAFGSSSICAQNSFEASGNRSSEIQRVRVDFETPMGFVRHLLLGFTPDNAATDGFDYGYDAANIEDLPDDLNWMIEDERYVIQGVGAFNENKAYPFGMFLSNSGVVKFSLLSLENFNQPINVFIYDILEDSFHQINDAEFAIDMDSFDYINRFYITFSNQTQIEDNLSLADHYSQFLRLKFNQFNRLLVVDTQHKFMIDTISIYNALGELLFNIDTANQDMVELHLNTVQSKFLVLKLETSVGVLYKKIMI